MKDVKYTFYEFPNDNQLAEIYSSADVTLLPSWYECFPLPPLESMACGTPVVTTRIGMSDYCFNNYNSLVIPPKNPEAIARALDKLLSNKQLQEKFRNNGFKTANQFTYSKTVDKFEEVFNNILK